MLWTLAGTLEERLEAAAASGITHVSLTSEHSRWTRAQRKRFEKALRGLGLRVHVVGATPSWQQARISMLDPHQRRALLDEVRRNVRIAVELEATAALLLTGNELEGVPRDTQYAELVESCKRCADIAGGAGVTLTLEPLNTTTDHPGYFLVDGRCALDLARLVDNPHLTVVLDLYHQQAQSGNALDVLQEAGTELSMVHVADFPGRHEPGTGSMDYDAIYAAAGNGHTPIDVVFEYVPTQEPVETLRAALSRLQRGVGL